MRDRGTTPGRRSWDRGAIAPPSLRPLCPGGRKGDAPGESDFGFGLILDKELMLEIAVCKKSSSGPCMTSCKPLKVIWENLGDFYGPHNTVHVDDTPINFMVNMNHGLTCTAWEAQLLSDEVDEDDELHRMKLYLLDILTEKDYAKLDHRKWRRRIKDLT